MATKPELQFEASAYLQTLIGRELFRSEDLAIVELVKNSYDSGATVVSIDIRPKTVREPGEIVIRDDGSGMTKAEFESRFMFAGFSVRADGKGQSDRVPTGEKGIGRFASDRLGEQLSIITKVKGAASSLRVDVDWSKFRNRKKKFSDITVPYTEGHSPELDGVESGTILRITQMRELWERDQVLSLRTALAQLLDPFHRPPDFEIQLNVQGSEVLSGTIVQPALDEQLADIVVSFRVLPKGIVERKRKGRLYPKGDKERLDESADFLPVVGLSGRFIYFLNRPTREQSRGLLPGVRIYRDGFHVEPFGSQAADWLGIAERRAKRAGHAPVVPSRLFGFVEISRTEHPTLRDTTSREALIDTPSARALVHLLRIQVDFLEGSIRKDVNVPRWKENRRKKVGELERAKLQTLSIMSFGLAHELRQPLQSIRTEAAIIAKRLKQLKIDDSYISTAQQNIDQCV